MDGLVRLDRVEMRASSVIVAFKPDVILKSVLGRHARARMTTTPTPHTNISKPSP